ncbi:MAG TPA: CHASE3 domain-containing protein [Candidatus Saccharimonadales bacterium]|nr:CHASE3 domain-containing protein [Candidatus Saccharimonadales bacterium]
MRTKWVAFVLLVLTPLLVLAGWTFHNIYLTSIVPGLTPMNPLSAVCFLLIAAALFAVGRKNDRITGWIGVAVMGIGLVMLTKYVFQVDLGIDRILFAHQLGTNRIAPNTAFNFTLTGIALIVLAIKRWRPFVLIPVGVVAFVSTLSLIGYAYGLKLLFGVPGLTPMALHTAGCFLLSCFIIIATLLLQTGVAVGLRIRVVLILILATVVIFGTVTGRTIQSVDQQQASIATTYQTIEALDDLNQMLVDAETGQRGFLLTGNESYLAPYNQSAGELDGHITHLAGLLNQLHEDGTALTKPLAALAHYKLDELNRTIQLRRQGKITEALAIVNTNEGKQYSDQMQTRFAAIENNELAHLKQLRTEGDHDRQVALWLQATGTALDVLLLLGAVLFIRQTLQQRQLAQDATQQALQALRVEKNKSEALLQSIGDGVFAIDSSEHIILFNPAAEQITQRKASEVIGKPLNSVLTFVNDISGKPIDEFIRDALAGKKAAMAQHTSLKCKDGSLVPVADSAAPIFNAHGKVQGAVIVFRDITRERQLERLKDDFVSVASHELRTPMGAIRAFTSLILAGDYGPVNKNLIEPLTDIRSSTLRLVNLVNDMLDVARIEAGRMRITLKDIDLTAVAHEATTALVPLAEEKKIKLSSRAHRAFTVQADPDKIKQVITNLVGNALKFTDKGSIKLDIQQAPNNKELIEVTITDTGMGISPDSQKRLFGKFEQISSQQEGRPPGTGLGLYISREIIRKQGGDMYIKHSEPGKGSVFAFTLPRAQSTMAKKTASDVKREASMHSDQK